MTEKEKALGNESGHPMLSSLQSERTKKGKLYQQRRPFVSLEMVIQ